MDKNTTERLKATGNYAPHWKATTKLCRLLDCRVQLLLSGVLTEKEAAKVKARILKKYR